MTPEDRFDRIEATLQATAETMQANAQSHGQAIAKLEASLQTLRAELTTQIEHSHAQTIEAMRDMQTEILRGIQAFAAGNHARITA